VAKATKKAAKKKASPKASRKASPTVTVDRRKPKTERREKSEPVVAGTERRKVQRRRQIDPTTCERDYSDAEVEFMRAMDDYKRANGRMFPTCSEILEVVAKLGYVQQSHRPAAATPDQLVAEQPDIQRADEAVSGLMAEQHTPASEELVPQAV
jgi:hypothetical protein